MLRFHNAVVADVAADLGPGFTAEEIFAEAQRIVRWHYQWIVLHEFLPHTVGQPMTDDVLTNGPKFYRWRNDPFIPVEFSVAAYRFGHSQVRPSYRAKLRHQRDRHRHGSVQRRSIAARRPITRCRASPHMR